MTSDTATTMLPVELIEAVLMAVSPSTLWEGTLAWVSPRWAAVLLTNPKVRERARQGRWSDELYKGEGWATPATVIAGGSYSARLLPRGGYIQQDIEGTVHISIDGHTGAVRSSTAVIEVATATAAAVYWTQNHRLHRWTIADHVHTVFDVPMFCRSRTHLLIAPDDSAVYWVSSMQTNILWKHKFDACMAVAVGTFLRTEIADVLFDANGDLSVMARSRAALLSFTYTPMHGWQARPHRNLHEESTHTTAMYASDGSYWCQHPMTTTRTDAYGQSRKYKPAETLKPSDTLIEERPDGTIVLSTLTGSEGAAFIHTHEW